jgi:hypothetical protein
MNLRANFVDTAFRSFLYKALNLTAISRTCELCACILVDVDEVYNVVHVQRIVIIHNLPYILRLELVEFNNILPYLNTLCGAGEVQAKFMYRSTICGGAVAVQ